MTRAKQQHYEILLLKKAISNLTAVSQTIDAVRWSVVLREQLCCTTAMSFDVVPSITSCPCVCPQDLTARNVIFPPPRVRS